MKNYLQAILCFVMLLAFTPLPAQNKKLPPSIILDTDIGPDYDDVGAMALLHAMADSGECRILATIASNKHPYIAAVLNVINTYYNRPGIPVGVVRSKAVNEPAHDKWDSLLAVNYPHTIRSNDQAEDAVVLYRRILAAQPDKSVTIVTVGFLTNMANLLQSKPDRFSNLNGKDLVQRKVKRLVSMAARFDNEMGKFKEFNVVRDAAASVAAFNNWPTSIIFSGFEIGMPIHTGLPIVNNAAIRHSPVKDVFARCIALNSGDKNGRNSWDETAVLVAVRGYEPYFNVVRGQIICHADGSNGWNANGQRDYYLVQKKPIAEMEKMLDNLIMHQPKK
jgi:inosine-uridine nucleoside N-ribohydrolase